jgi:uncharacterized protein (DUF1015 family)
VRLVRFGEGNIYPHEETMAGPKQDRLLLTQACRANLSQIFGLYPDPAGEVESVLQRAIAGKTPLEATDHLGVVHRMWPVTDVAAITALSHALGPKPVFIADGHHRYETACNYRDQLAASGKLDPNHPANFVLMMCVGMQDSGMIVLPTHRLFRGVPDLASGDLVKALGDCFTTRIAGEGNDLAETVWQEIETEGQQGTLGFFTQRDERWVLARITESGRRRLAEVASDHSDDWRDLGVSILHRLVIDTLLAAKEVSKPTYVHLVEEVVQGLETGNYPLAALVMPATLSHIEAMSTRQERMPAKSTYFYPKLLSGLVINPLE